MAIDASVNMSTSQKIAKPNLLSFWCAKSKGPGIRSIAKSVAIHIRKVNNDKTSVLGPEMPPTSNMIAITKTETTGITDVLILAPTPDPATFMSLRKGIEAIFAKMPTARNEIPSGGK
jgi:hypothetical protein